MTEVEEISDSIIKKHFKQTPTGGAEIRRVVRGQMKGKSEHLIQLVSEYVYSHFFQEG